MASPRIALRPPKSVPSPESDQKDAPIRNRVGTLSGRPRTRGYLGADMLFTLRCPGRPPNSRWLSKHPATSPPPTLLSVALHLRIRQQEFLAELGVLALQGTNFIDMLNHTARMTAEGLDAEYCKVLEYIPAENRLLVRAGVGWDEGVVGQASVGADLASPAGFALRTGKPVISNHLENEQRFRTPELAC